MTTLQETKPNSLSLDERSQDLHESIGEHLGNVFEAVMFGPVDAVYDRLEDKSDLVKLLGAIVVVPALVFTEAAVATVATMAVAAAVGPLATIPIVAAGVYGWMETVLTGHALLDDL